MNELARLQGEVSAADMERVKAEYSVVLSRILTILEGLQLLGAELKRIRSDNKFPDWLPDPLPTGLITNERDKPEYVNVVSGIKLAIAQFDASLVQDAAIRKRAELHYPQPKAPWEWTMKYVA